MEIQCLPFFPFPEALWPAGKSQSVLTSFFLTRSQLFSSSPPLAPSAVTGFLGWQACLHLALVFARGQQSALASP